ncbi:CoB--CoM heterodisulfide reductase subunit A [Methanosarcina sp. MTP4]|uniref:ferredoxin:CoB-CoM heterodisulfide reductase subunit HdrA n=1 Tax=Methanosarcina sp. MTP4 TaxID=1434100 RepID=UPI0006156269|nr:ferredoxin:CoB-CoM heterodisulfide reductase subunit HdrA [Methanosarcina sp. MTP4]AKB25753.1 CoB--CoM heterodisulfide reductase subunit A [Methanosarcina sp. MTP4]
MTVPPEKTAVFICHCSGNISEHVDIKAVKAALKAEGISVFDYEYLCSSPGQDLIKSKIEEKGLEKVVIGSCTPSKHGLLFNKCVKEAGLNRAMLEIANLREQCAWVHPDTAEATEKAITLLRGKLKRLDRGEPLQDIKVDISPQALVIGGGIAGITAALNLADNGIPTYLVEKDSSIGGQMAKIGKIFSPDKLAEECAMCSLSPLMNEVAAHPKITLLTRTEVEAVRGSAGKFKVTLRTRPGYVRDTCTACGRCSRVCPVLVENEFNCGHKDKKAISMRFSQSVPKTYSIDPDHCLQLNGVPCGKCAEACRTEAIDFGQQEEVLELNFGAIIAATGFKEYDASQKPQYGYGIFENVLTQMELARMLGINGPTKGKLLRLSDAADGGNLDLGDLDAGNLDAGNSNPDSSNASTNDPSNSPTNAPTNDPSNSPTNAPTNDPALNSSESSSLKEKLSDPPVPGRIVMIQCVGSRDEKAGGIPYCSRYCCMAALKHASLIRKKYPDTEITICYIDMRAFGFYENYYRAVQDMGVSFVRGRPAEVIRKSDKSLIVRVEDTLNRKILELPADLVVLSAAMLPSPGTREIAGVLNVSQDETGFIKERHSKLKPVDSSVDGIFVCGTAQGPKDITDTIAQAGLAAARARAFIADSPKVLEHELVSINQLTCTRCGDCLSCPFDALSFSESGRVVVDPLVCTGCGYCTEICERGAVQVAGFTKSQLKAEIEGVLEAGDLLGFVNSGISSLTCDNIGNSVLSYPSNVKLVKVPTCLVVDKELIRHALRHGAASVLFVEDPPDNPRAEIIFPLALRHFEKLKEELGADGCRLHFKKAYVPNTKGLAGTFTSLAREGEMNGEMVR